MHIEVRHVRKTLRILVWIWDDQALFDELKSQKKVIEQYLGHKLEWEDAGDKVATAGYDFAEFDVDNKKAHEKALEATYNELIGKFLNLVEFVREANKNKGDKGFFKKLASFLK